MKRIRVMAIPKKQIDTGSLVVLVLDMSKRLAKQASESSSGARKRRPKEHRG